MLAQCVYSKAQPSENSVSFRIPQTGGGRVTESDSPVRKHADVKVRKTSSRSMLMCWQTGRMRTESTHFCFPFGQIFIVTAAGSTNWTTNHGTPTKDEHKKVKPSPAMILKLIKRAKLRPGSLTSSPCQKMHFKIKEGLKKILFAVLIKILLCNILASRYYNLAETVYCSSPRLHSPVLSADSGDIRGSEVRFVLAPIWFRATFLSDHILPTGNINISYFDNILNYSSSHGASGLPLWPTWLQALHCLCSLTLIWFCWRCSLQPF